MTAMDQVQLKGILDVLRKNNEDAGKRTAILFLQCLS